MDEVKQRKSTEAQTRSTNSELWSWIKAFSVALLFMLLLNFVAKPILVSGSSMEPSFHHRDYVLISPLSYKIGKPQHEDVVVFETGEPMDTLLIKRVIGIEGDTIRIHDGDVYRNGEKLEESYILEEDFYGEGEWKVPEDHLFVLGDNRNNSTDSRSQFVDFVPTEKVKGKVWVKVFSLN